MSRLSNLRSCGHEPATIAVAVVEHCNRHVRRLTRKQKRALRHNLQLQRANILSGSRSQTLHAYFRVFDELFFEGKLRGRYSLRFEREQLPGVRGVTAPRGRCGAADIIVFERPSSGPIDYLGTLLHEMCHAIFMVHTPEQDGFAGHGWPGKKLQLRSSLVREVSLDFL